MEKNPNLYKNLRKLSKIKGRYTVINRSVLQEDVAVLSVYVPNNRV